MKMPITGDDEVDIRLSTLFWFPHTISDHQDKVCDPAQLVNQTVKQITFWRTYTYIAHTCEGEWEGAPLVNAEESYQYDGKCCELFSQERTRCVIYNFCQQLFSIDSKLLEMMLSSYC